MFYKLLNEIGNYVDKTTGEKKNLLEANIAYTPSGINYEWLEFSTKGEALNFFNIEADDTPETDGDFIVATQSKWINFINRMNMDLQSIKDRSRRSISKISNINEYLWVAEMWDLSFPEMLWVLKNELIILEKYQYDQLGINVKYIKDSNNERILNNNYSIVDGKETELVKWCRVFDPDIPFNLTEEEELTYINNNNIKNKIKILFDVFEVS